ncbi:MAG: hypothetical protein JW741_23510 [Sedimentisphaerales bacterium]|nr:hypothetical protein [Sedimentisphaerales bacterium]
MFEPTTFTAAVGLMFLTMLCWGSWANTYSVCRGQYRFELFYWDFATGVMLASLGLSIALGSGSALFRGEMNGVNASWALLSGLVFNIGNVLLVAAISLTGMAVAFPVCISLALLIGVGVSWWIEPSVPALWMLLGSVLILASMLADAAAYRAISTHRPFSLRGIGIAVLGGVFMGAFPPCLQRAFVGAEALDPYAASTMFAIGVLLCTLVVNYPLMRFPIAGDPPVAMCDWLVAPKRFHVYGLLGGAIWALGGVFNFIAGDKVGMAVGYAFGAGGTLVAAAWGVLVWREFREAPPRAYVYLGLMFVTFIIGITIIGYARAHVS